MGQPLRAHVTWREYAQLPDDSIRYEVLDWLVDIDARAVTILVLGSAGYEVHASGTGDTALSSPTLQGLALLPAQVFDRI